MGKKSNQIQGASNSVKFLEVQWYGACRDILKDKLLRLAPPTNKK